MEWRRRPNALRRLNGSESHSMCRVRCLEQWPPDFNREAHRRLHRLGRQLIIQRCGEPVRERGADRVSSQQCVVPPIRPNLLLLPRRQRLRRPHCAAPAGPWNASRADLKPKRGIVGSRPIAAQESFIIHVIKSDSFMYVGDRWRTSPDRFKSHGFQPPLAPALPQAPLNVWLRCACTSTSRMGFRARCTCNKRVAVRCLRVCMLHGVLALVQANTGARAVYGSYMQGPRVVSHFRYWQPLVFDDTVQPPLPAPLLWVDSFEVNA